RHRHAERAHAAPEPRLKSGNEAPTLSSFAAPPGHEGPLRGPWGAAGLGAARRPAGPMTSNGLSSLLWFVAILALIPATLWFLKRTPLGGGGGAGVMKSIASLPLSTSQRIVTVEVGSGEERRWLVLG